MTVQKIDSSHEGTDWQEVLTRARDEGADILIEQNGEPAAAVIPYEDYVAIRAELDGVRSARKSGKRVTLTGHPHIGRVEKHYGGRPIIRGTGVGVQIIVGHLRLGYTPEQLVELYAGTFTLGQVYDALSYYEEHREEIERGFAEDLEALEKGPQLQRRA